MNPDNKQDDEDFGLTGTTEYTPSYPVNKQAQEGDAERFVEDHFEIEDFTTSMQPILAVHEYYQLINDLEALIVQKTREAVIKEWEAVATKRKPTHGNCCTCQTCGEYHDDCRCEIIEIAERRLATLKGEEK